MPVTRFLHRAATPLVTGLFLVSLVSGVALYLRWAPAAFHEMHEVLSLLLILPFGLHLWRNWRPMLGYLGRWPMTAALALSAAAALAFAAPALLGDGAEARGGPPQLALARLVMEGTPAEVAPLLGVTPGEVVARLAAAGFAGAEGQTLAEIAAASGGDEGALAAALAAP